MKDKTRHRFTINQKITVFILLSSFIVGFTGLALLYWSEYNLLRQTIGRDYATMSELLGTAMGRIISREIESTAVFMDSSDRLLIIEKYNLKYAGMSNESKEAYFKDMEGQWAKAGDNHPLIIEYTKSPVGVRLSEIAKDDPSMAEIFITDKYGGLVAASDRTSDFYQGDEEWWQKSFNNGKGDVFLDKIEFDPSSKSIGMAIAVPVKNKAKEVIGVGKNILEINRLFSPLKNFSIGKSGHVGLVDKEGYLIFHPGIQAMTQKLPDKVFKKIVSENSGYLVESEPDQLHKKKIFISYFKINHPELLKSGIEWWVCVTQDEDEVFAPLQKLIFSFILVALIMLAILLSIGFFFGAILVKPIIRLCDATEKVAKGNLDYKVEIKTNDEIEDLAGSFNSMLTGLKNTFTTIDKLNDEIALRKKTEEILYKSEEQYRTLFTESRDAVMLLLPDDGFISGNPAAIEMFGCRDEEDFKSRSPAELSPEFQPDGSRSLDKSREMMMLAVEKGSSLFEWTHKRIDGGEFIATVLLSRLKISGKNLLQATVRDITEQKRAESALKKSQAWFSTTLSSIGDAVITVDTDGLVTFINPVAQKLTGWSEVEAIGRHIDEVFVIRKEGTDEKVDNPVIVVLSHGQIVKLANHTVLVSKDASRRAIDDSAAPIKSANSQDTMGVVLVFRDVTERNKIEEELRKLSVAVEQSPAVVVITDKDGNISYVNPKFVQLTGYEYQEVIGKNPRILRSEEQPREFYENLWDTILAGGEWRGEFHNKRKDGSLYWESASISPVKDSKGIITNFIAVKEDITERKRILEELKQKNTALEKLDQLKSDFVSMVSHELRTPLSITKEGISLVLDGVTGSINPKQSKILTTSKNNIDRLARIINSLLDISKIESGRVELKKKNVDFRGLIRNVFAAFENKAKEKGLELRINLPKEQGPDLYIDEDRIIQVFTNLIGNAIKFTERGHIDVSLAQKDEEVEFTISDTGIGIAAEELPRVFNKFLQFGRAAGAGEKGTGLGLSIAKGLIELHRGRIWVESEPGKGTKFIFTLPKYHEGQKAREYIEDAIEEAIKANTHLTLVIATLAYSDKIKSISEELMREMEKIIRSKLYRSKDLVLQYPKEFFILMRDCGKNSGVMVQERIEQALRIYFENNNLANEMKVSFGLAVYPDEAINYHGLVNKARGV
jgi:PAS domain S-box-containing protein